jgi:hypothetical protein
MDKDLYEIPVLLITFNRPGCAKQVFEKIKQLKPKKLFVFSDAPRAGKNEEAIAVNQCRSLFDDKNITWDCDIKRWFAQSNMGCGLAVSSAITWMFDSVPYGIILEDDCLPNITFFDYCSIMLRRYASNSKVMHIAGTRWNDEYESIEDSYFFSKIGHVWGWATWKRAWKLYDFDMQTWDKAKDRTMLYKQLKSSGQTQFWMDNFERMYNKEAAAKDTWDYQWQYTLFKNRGLAVVPYVNLISNIGVEGAHASSDSKDEGVFNRKTITWRENKEIEHKVEADDKFDDYHIVHYFMKADRPLIYLKWFVKSLLSRLRAVV